MTSYKDVLRSKLYPMIISQIVNFLHPICADSLPYRYSQFVASVFGHQLDVSIYDYLLLLVVTSLECIVTLTQNNSNCFLAPICAVHLEVSRQFMASVFGTLLIGIYSNL